MRSVQEMLGHALLSTTQLYTKVSVAQLKRLHTTSHPAAMLNEKLDAGRHDRGCDGAALDAPVPRSPRGLP